MDFKQSKDFPNYEVSKCGKVRDIKRNKIKSIHSNNTGNKYVSLRTNGTNKNIAINRLIYSVHNDIPYYELPTLKYKDNDNNNNHLDNIIPFFDYTPTFKKCLRHDNRGVFTLYIKGDYYYGFKTLDEAREAYKMHLYYKDKGFEHSLINDIIKKEIRGVVPTTLIKEHKGNFNVYLNIEGDILLFNGFNNMDDAFRFYVHASLHKDLFKGDKREFLEELNIKNM